MATLADTTRCAWRSGVEARLVARISPAQHVDRDTTPMLLLHSDADRTVPYEQSELLWRTLQESGVRADLVKFPDAPHTF